MENPGEWLGSSETLGVRVRRGAAIGVLANTVLRVGTLATSVILARILSPSDFGVYAIGQVIFALLLSFNDLGVTVALIQWPGQVKKAARTIMSISLLASALLYVALYLAAPLIARAFSTPGETLVIRLLGLALIIDAVACVPVGFLGRLVLQGRRFCGDIAAFVASTSTTIYFALNGGGALALTFGFLVGSLAATVAYTILSPERVLPGWDTATAGKLVRQGLPLAGSSLLALSVTNVDNLIVGAATSQRSLGLYTMAFNQSSWPVNVFTEATRKVALAGFSRLVDDRQALNRAFANSLSLLITLTMPICVLLIFFAEPLLRFVYGQSWVAAAPVLMALSVLGVMRVGMFVAYDLLVALDRGRRLLWTQGAWLVALVPALAAGAMVGGIRGVAVCHVLVAAAVAMPLIVRELRKAGIAVRPAIYQCVTPLWGAALMALVAIAVRVFIKGDFVELAVGGAAGVAVYAPAAWKMRKFLPKRHGASA